MYKKSMKKTSILIALLALLLTACSSSPSGMQANSRLTSGDLRTETQLVAGTLKLESTEQAVTGEQAKELLVMWQVYQDLTSSSSAAQAEIDGLVEQIQETMTAKQMEAISAMNLTQQDVFKMMQAQGGDIGQASQSTSGSTTQTSGGFAPPDGGMAGGPPPDGGAGGGAPPDGGIVGIVGAAPSTSTDQSQNTGAVTSEGRTAGVPAALVEALIQLLEQKMDSSVFP